MTSNGAMNIKEEFKIMGIKLPYFIAFSVLVFGAMYLDVLPKGMAGAIPVMILLGAIFGLIGDHTPIIKDYFGGGSIVIVFGCAALVMFKIIPESTITNISEFFTGSGNFIDIALATLIAGSIMGMDRKLLVKAAVRYLPCILAAQALGLAIVAIVGEFTGYGFAEAILYVGIPAMGGGMGAGAIPLSEMFSSILNLDASVILTKMIPSVSLANAFAIVFAGLLDKFGKAKPSLTGNGLLMPVGKEAVVDDSKKPQATLDYKQFGIGFLVAMSFLMIARMINMALPAFHTYAYMVIVIVLAKSFKVLPENLEDACAYWYNALIKNISQLLLVGIGIALLDLAAVVESLSLIYVILVAATVLGSLFGSMIVGKLMGFYPIEAGLSVGLCSTNMGGSGDLAVLGAANRMELLPFAQISTRIGGSIILMVASILVRVLA